MTDAVFDTVIYLQAALSNKGAAYACWQLVEKGEVRVFINEAILAEIENVLKRPKLRQKYSVLTDEKKEKVFPSQKFFTDKRNEENTNEKNKLYKSTTVWKGKNIFIVTNDGEKQTSATKFILSKDGKELTVTRLPFLTGNDSLTSQYYFIGLPHWGQKSFQKSFRIK